MFMMLIVIACLIWARNWLGQALSEPDKNGTYRPSSLRLGGFIFVILVFFCESYTTLRKQDFDTTHLSYILVMILLCWGLLRASQLISVYKGKTEPEQKETT